MSEPAVTGPSRKQAPASFPSIEARRLSVRFGPVVANDEVSLCLFPTEIHCVLGENGAGKSTLMKLLYGLYRPDRGEILAGGTPVRVTSPQVARRLGLGMVFQDFRLVNALTVLENVALAVADLAQFQPERQVRARFQEMAELIGLRVNPRAQVRTLSIAQRQQLEIAKLLVAGSTTLILDEPTSVLAPQEAEALFDRLRDLRARGLSVVMITHKVKEARAVADRVTVLRGGRSVVEGVAPGTIGDGELVEAMVGRAVPPLARSRVSTDVVEPVLQVRDLCVRGQGGRGGLANVTFDVFPREIVGVAAVAGSGQSELVDALSGAAPWSHGTISIRGRRIPHAEPRAALEAGVVTVPEDPLRQWMVPRLSVLEHIALGGIRTSGRAGIGMDWRRARAQADRLATTAALNMASPERQVNTLSGGNVQRVVLTQVLASPATLFVLSYPVRGLDVASCRQVHELVLARRAEGAGIVLISEDLEELLTLADRILVLHNGQVAGIRPAGATDRAELGRLMLGAAA